MHLNIFVGNLIVFKSCQIEYLDVQSINKFPVDTFFTLNTDQEITSDILIPTFHSVSIDTNMINGINFKTDVARLNEDNVIESNFVFIQFLKCVKLKHVYRTAPVKIFQAHIGNLTLANKEDDDFVTRHVVGTRVEDLSQVYNGKVVIKGSLKFSNVILDSPKTKLFVDETQFQLNVAEHFWMKTVDQVRNWVRFIGLIVV